MTAPLAGVWRCASDVDPGITRTMSALQSISSWSKGRRSERADALLWTTMGTHPAAIASKRRAELGLSPAGAQQKRASSILRMVSSDCCCSFCCCPRMWNVETKLEFGRSAARSRTAPRTPPSNLPVSPWNRVRKRRLRRGRLSCTEDAPATHAASRRGRRT
eukprot:6722568-Prymnesium_polylepis.1